MRKKTYLALIILCISICLLGSAILVFVYAKPYGVPNDYSVITVSDGQTVKERAEGSPDFEKYEKAVQKTLQSAKNVIYNNLYQVKLACDDGAVDITKYGMSENTPAGRWIELTSNHKRYKKVFIQFDSQNDSQEKQSLVLYLAKSLDTYNGGKVIVYPDCKIDPLLLQ